MPESLQSWLSLLEHRHHKSIDLGLERCARVWHAMGAPRPARRIATIAGTNGKGSTVAYLSALLASGGARVGTYTSPHLLRFNERVRIAGVDASDEALVAAFEMVEAARGAVSLTYFEFTTLAAFHLMHTERLDWAVLEVGLGGRLDTVNLVDADLAVITPIGLDHQEYLGDSRNAIAREKAGIMRAGKPVVCGDRNPPETLLEMARELGAPIHLLGPDFDVEDSNPARFRWVDRQHAFPEPPLPGRHQRDNLATAMAALAVLAPGLLADREAVQTALATVSVPGRLSPHPADDRVLLDVGHNPLAAGVVAAALAARTTAAVHCVLGMLRDKDVEGAVAALAGQVSHWYLASLDGARGQSGQSLHKRLRNVPGARRATSFDSVAQALDVARKQAGATDTVLVFGSFQTVAAALRRLDQSRAAETG
ncbi:MAG: bifunctional tetrahydrofolate synthase/dihydrofolate synthase [Xanthomonadales bacterium]|nr:bifunctional tetrahydrofolate synthase/dihydrofolate synthase [Xanthomonadales bacterium]